MELIDAKKVNKKYYFSAQEVSSEKKLILIDKATVTSGQEATFLSIEFPKQSKSTREVTMKDS